MHMKENKMRDVLHISRAWTIAALALIASASLAGADDALYADVPPEDAVFVRWLGYDDIPAAARQIYGSELPSDAVKGDAYTAISAASLEGATPGAFLSVVSGAEGDPSIVQEPARDEKSKVHLVLVNGDERPANVVVATNGAEVIGATGHLQAVSRAVNPVSVRLAVQVEGEETPLDEFDVRLSRGQNLTFFVKDGQVHLIEDQFGPVLKTW